MKQSWFTTFDLIIIAVMAALGLGTKQLVRPIVAPITIALVIPGGALAGGFYMLWLVLSKRFVPKFGSGLMFGFVQALVVMILPFGSHGIFTFITYTLPGFGIDLIDLALRPLRANVITSLIEGAITNMIGTISVSFLIFDNPIEVLLFIILLALFSGNLGGLLAHLIIKNVKNPLMKEMIFQEEEISIKNHSEEKTTIPGKVNEKKTIKEK
jgi:energy-coupling factor transport system substrate-specific component